MVWSPAIKIIMVMPMLAQICTTITQIKASVGGPPKNSEWMPSMPRSLAIGPPKG